MKHTVFDNALRQRAAQEKFDATTRAENTLTRAMHAGRCKTQTEKTPGRRKQWMYASLAAGAACMAALVLLLAQPPADDRHGTSSIVSPAITQTVLSPAQQEYQVAPTVEADARLTLDWARVQATLKNDTQDIWLVKWQADMDGLPIEQPDSLIWLEPGAACTDRATWAALNGDFETPRRIDWSYTGYRVVADMLHWIDGDWLTPSQEGYEQQQSLITDAFECDSLILSPGRWENGKAGEMDLVLPDAYLAAHPEQTALAYYLEKGMLEQASAELCSGSETRELSEYTHSFDVSAEPFTVVAGEGCVQRLMTADVGEEHALFIIDCVFESAEAQQAFAEAYPSAYYSANSSSGALNDNNGADPDADMLSSSWTLQQWQDDNGMWHMTGGMLCYPVALEAGDEIIIWLYYHAADEVLSANQEPIVYTVQ